MSKLESVFQKELIKEIKDRFPGCIVTKIEPYIQGMPDILILYEDKWATLECKRSQSSHKQPNQEFYVKKMKQMSFSAFIFPENKEEVLDELERTLKYSR